MSKLCHVKEDVTDSENKIFEYEKSRGVPLPTRETCCRSCAAMNLYGEISIALGKQTKDVQDEVAKRWFCHDTPNKACKGIRNYLDKFNKE